MKVIDISSREREREKEFDLWCHLNIGKSDVWIHIEVLLWLCVCVGELTYLSKKYSLIKSGHPWQEVAETAAALPRTTPTWRVVRCVGFFDAGRIRQEERESWGEKWGVGGLSGIGYLCSTQCPKAIKAERNGNPLCNVVGYFNEVEADVEVVA